MKSDQFTTILLIVGVLVALARLAAGTCSRLRQPRFLGEMLVGVLAGGVLALDDPATAAALDLIHWLGLTFLMFLSGTHVHRVLARETRRESMILLCVGTSIPFIAVFAAAPAIPTEGLAGPRGSSLAVLLVLATGTAVTSIPVITRIFHDLGILRTEFASLVLGVAIIDDIVLWVVTAATTTLASEDAITVGVLQHALISCGFLGAGLALGPRLLAAAHRARWNVLERTAPTAYLFAIMLLYMTVAASLGVTVVLAAFLAGVGCRGRAETSDRARHAAALAGVERVGYAVFIPIYFVIVGAKLQLGASVTPALVLGFLLGSSVLRVAAVAVAARLAGYGRRDAANLAVATNARGGPGIVLATVVFDCGLISAELFTALVVTAVVTSQLAAIWLGSIVRAGRPLLARVRLREVGGADHAGR